MKQSITLHCNQKATVFRPTGLPIFNLSKFKRNFASGSRRLYCAWYYRIDNYIRLSKKLGPWQGHHGSWMNLGSRAATLLISKVGSAFEGKKSPFQFQWPRPARRQPRRPCGFLYQWRCPWAGCSIPQTSATQSSIHVTHGHAFPNSEINYWSCPLIRHIC